MHDTYVNPLCRRYAGREMQEKFFETMFSGIGQAERETCFATLETIGKNMDAILKGTAK